MFVYGGTRDQSYPNVRGLMETYPNSKLGVINIDSHLDVRPFKNGRAHSGSSYFQMLED